MENVAIIEIMFVLFVLVVVIAMSINFNTGSHLNPYEKLPKGEKIEMLGKEFIIGNWYEVKKYDKKIRKGKYIGHETVFCELPIFQFVGIKHSVDPSDILKECRKPFYREILKFKI